MKLYQTIVFNQIKESRVIDCGCGNGELLKALIKEKECEGYGIEQSFKECMSAIGQGSLVSPTLSSLTLSKLR